MEMTVEREKMKALAVETLKKLDVYEPYIRKFAAKKSTVTMFERFGVYYINGLSDGKDELHAKIEEVEKRYEGVVYAVLHYFVDDSEMYAFLLVSKYNLEEYGEPVLFDTENSHIKYALAYVWNKTCDYCSELGDIAVACHYGCLAYVV